MDRRGRLNRAAGIRLVLALLLLVAVAAATRMLAPSGGDAGPAAGTATLALQDLGDGLPRLASVPPPARDLVWFQRNAEQVPGSMLLHALDWSGAEVGSITLPCPLPCTWQQSPDGQRLLVNPGDAPTSLAAKVYRSDGTPVGAIPGGDAQWADDSRTLCLLQPAPGGATGPFTELDQVDPAVGRLVPVTTLAPAATGAEASSWRLLACSTRRGVAVLVRRLLDLTDVRVLDLAGGAVRYAAALPAWNAACGCRVSDLLVNHDASVVLENPPQGARTLDLASGATAAAWPSRPQVQALGLSWNGRLVLIDSALVDAASGAVVWRAPSPAVLVAARPWSDDVLVSLAPGNELIVRGDGIEVPLPPGFP